MKEIVVIGGGVTGLWCAYHLQKLGCEVTIVDQGEMLDGCSHGNAGMIVPSHFIPLASPGVVSQGIRWMFRKDSPFSIKPRLNLELVQWLWRFYRSSTTSNVHGAMSLLRDLHQESREMYKQLETLNGFDFGFSQKGILMLYKTLKAERDEEKAAQMAEELGIASIQYACEALNQLEPGIHYSVAGGIHYPGDAHLDPGLFMLQMVQYLKAEKVTLLPKHAVSFIEDNGPKGAKIHFSNGQYLHAGHTVVSAGVWSAGLMKRSGFRLPLQDGKGYSMDYSSPGKVPGIPSILHEARVAVTPMGNKLRVAGTLEISGLDSKVNKTKVDSMIRAVGDYYPGTTLPEKPNVWYGFRPCTPDGLPFVGRLQAGSAITVATGHAMMGLSLAPATGRLIADEITNKPYKKAHQKLNPNRF